MRFKEFLEESFDQPYSYKWKVRGTKFWEGSFESLDSKINVLFGKSEWKHGSWNIYFDRDGTIEKTGDGDQFRVFSTVLAMIAELIAKIEPDELTFSAHKLKDETNSRANLYLKLCTRFASSNGYAVKVNTEEVHMGHGEMEQKTNFTLTKIGSNDEI